MLTPRTPSEVFESLFLAVEQFIDKGLCWQCAVVMASESTGVSRERVEDVWIRRQAELMTSGPEE